MPAATAVSTYRRSLTLSGQVTRRGQIPPSGKLISGFFLRSLKMRAFSPQPAVM